MRIGFEACGGAHYWARTLHGLGHDARIMAVKYVVPHRTKGKNDLNDAVAICQAVQHSSTRFPVKSPEQQAILSVHRMRENWVRERTAFRIRTNHTCWTLITDEASSPHARRRRKRTT